MVANKRGKLILIEGLDRTGKTTQCTLLAKRLKCKYYKFPNRDTPIGKIINSYLTQEHAVEELSDQSIHLLFSSNRWEAQKCIEAVLLSGENVILDRYVYSGIAYSLAKETKGMDYNWCLSCDRGLLKPDLTIFLMNSNNFQNQGFGDEIYEKKEFQEKVRYIFMKLFDEYEDKDYILNHFRKLDVTGMGIEDVYNKLEEFVQSICAEDDGVFLHF